MSQFRWAKPATTLPVHRPKTGMWVNALNRNTSENQSGVAVLGVEAVELGVGWSG